MKPLKTSEQVKEAIDYQKMLCDNASYPHFAPSDGKCFECGLNVYQSYEIGSRISWGRDGTELVTGCPHCHYSYCE